MPHTIAAVALPPPPLPGAPNCCGDWPACEAPTRRSAKRIDTTLPCVCDIRGPCLAVEVPMLVASERIGKPPRWCRIWGVVHSRAEYRRRRRIAFGAGQ